MNTSELYNIFIRCFPYIPVAERVFFKKISSGKYHFFIRYNNNKPVAFAAVSGNSIALLCVVPEMQKMGYGTALLNECEKFIINEKCRTVILGRGGSDFFFGAVINDFSHNFFEKNGYCAYNGCLNMVLDLDEFSYSYIGTEYRYPENVVYEIYNDRDYIQLINAVSSVEPKWITHYTKASDILVAKKEGRIVGFTSFNCDAQTLVTTDYDKTGMLQYVGVIPHERNKGIGMNMIACATQILKNSSCSKAFIDYTCLDKWYSKLGYQDFLWFWMGEKTYREKY